VGAVWGGKGLPGGPGPEEDRAEAEKRENMPVAMPWGQPGQAWSFVASSELLSRGIVAHISQRELDRRDWKQLNHQGHSP
jgi:hypothetical protein